MKSKKSTGIAYLTAGAMALLIATQASAQLTANNWISTDGGLMNQTGNWSLGVAPHSGHADHHLFINDPDPLIVKDLNNNRAEIVVGGMTVGQDYSITWQISAAGNRPVTVEQFLVNEGTLYLNRTGNSYTHFLTYTGSTLDNRGAIHMRVATAGGGSVFNLAGGNANEGTIRPENTNETGSVAFNLTSAGTFTNEGTVWVTNSHATGSAVITGVAGSVYDQADSVTRMGTYARFEVEELHISGGTFELDGDAGYTDRIENTVAVTLSGGTLASNGLSEREATGAGMGDLTVEDSSVIDFGQDGGSILWFESYAHTAGTLTMLNWGGTTGQFGGSDQLRFSQALTQAELDSIVFTINPSYSAQQSYIEADGGYWEVAAIPEPGALLLTLLGAGALAIRRRALRLR